MPDTPHQRKILSFGRRIGKSLRGAKRNLLETELPSLSIPPATDKSQTLAIETLFDADPKEIWMEIGFGYGEHLSYQAQQHPDVGFIGCEPFMNGVAELAHTIVEKNISNIRIYSDDVTDLLPTIPDETLGRAFVLFPDPWPKTRHHKRRILSSEFLELIAQKMKPGAKLYIATDHLDYARWILVHGLRCPSFEWTARSKHDWQTPPKEWITTRYQQKAQKQGRSAFFFQFRRL